MVLFQEYEQQYRNAKARMSGPEAIIRAEAIRQTAEIWEIDKQDVYRAIRYEQARVIKISL